MTQDATDKKLKKFKIYKRKTYYCIMDERDFVYLTTKNLDIIRKMTDGSRTTNK